MCIAHGADVANQKTILELQPLSHLGRRRLKAEKIGLYAILDYGNLACRNVPIPYQDILEGGRHDHDAVGTAVKKPGDGSQHAMEQASLTAGTDGCQ